MFFSGTPRRATTASLGFWSRGAAVLAISFSVLACAQEATHVSVPAHGPGKIFDGIGETSGGGAISRLLINYPEPQRSQILDYLFKPNYGASLQMLKVEIGGDGNSTEGAEPSHMHTAKEENYTRGYEWWLIKEARKRNSKIKLIALAWDFPAWVQKADSRATAEYLAKFLDAAKRVYGEEIDYVGLWNETKMPYDFIPILRKTLDAHGLRTKIVADDSVKSWAIAEAVSANPELARNVDVIATHYPGSETTATARQVSERDGKLLWSSEDGPWNDRWGSGGEWGRAYAETLNRNYIQGRMTATGLWCLVSAYYDILDIPNAGLLRAQSPWSGSYEVMSPLWVVAHTTQFAQPGWQYLDQSSGLLDDGGSYVTLVHGSEVSVVVETIAAGKPQPFELTLDARYTDADIAIWRTDAHHSFLRIDDKPARSGKVPLLLEPGAIYTITNTHTQHKGDARPPESKPFPVPYRDDFESYAVGDTTPRYFIEQNGSYETVACAGGRAGKCLRQVVEQPPITWDSGRDSINLGTASVIGGKSWRNYRVSADFFLDQPGYARVMGRVGKVTEDGLLSGYQLYLLTEGRWELRTSVKGETILTGALSSPLKTWHKAALLFDDDQITVEIDGRTAGSVRDSRYSHGMAGLGNGWNVGEYDNFEIAGITGKVLIDSEALAKQTHIPLAAMLSLPTSFDGGVRLTWDSKEDRPDGYRVMWGTSSSTMTSVKDIGMARDTRIEGLNPEKTYYFAIVPYNQFGEGPISNVRTAKPLASHPVRNNEP